MNPVIMIFRNGLEMTKNAVDSVLAQDIPVKLTCVDNASNDGTFEWLFRNRKMVHSFRHGEPRSVAQAWNNGLFALSCEGFSYALVVNNDVVLRPDTYRELLADGGPFVTGVGVDSMAEMDKPFVKAVRPHPDFSCFLIRRSTWNIVGQFDEKFEGAYCEDADYHVRMHRAGIRAISIGLPFYHVASGTIKSAVPEEAQRIREQADRNREYFNRKYGCKIGGAEYEALFSEETFGMEAHAKAKA